MMFSYQLSGSSVSVGACSQQKRLWQIQQYCKKMKDTNDSTVLTDLEEESVFDVYQVR